MTAANDHLSRIMDALDRYSKANHQLAVEEPANEFEQQVNSLYAMQNLVKEIKSILKPLEADERELRDGLAESLRMYFGGKLKEGVNNYELSNRRKVKFTHKVDRKVDVAAVAVARAKYEALEGADKPAKAFDDLLRVKYELAAAPYKSLGDPAKAVVADMLVTKFAAPVVEVD